MGNSKDDSRKYSTVIKVDGVTLAGAEMIVEGAKKAARTQEDARGTFIVTPTEELRTSGGQHVIEKDSKKLIPLQESSISPRCKAIKYNDERCSHPALPGNYGFCGRHR